MSWAEAKIMMKQSSGQNRLLFTNNTTWKIPDGVTQLQISACAAGENGSSNANYRARAGEFILNKIVNVISGTDLNLTIGTGNTVISGQGISITLIAGSISRDYPNNKLGIPLGLSGKNGGAGGSSQCGSGGQGGRGGYGGAFGIGGYGAGGGGAPGKILADYMTDGTTTSYYSNGCGAGSGGGINETAGNSGTYVRDYSKKSLGQLSGGSPASTTFYVIDQTITARSGAGGTTNHTGWDTGTAGNGGTGANAINAFYYGAGGGGAGADSCNGNGTIYGAKGKGGSASSGSGGMVFIEW